MKELFQKVEGPGSEWLGVIPKHWQAMPIKRLSRVRRGASPRPIDDQKYFDPDGEFSWVRIADVSASERYLEATTQKLSELGASLSVKRFPGDFFLSIAGTVGKPIITKIKCCIHDGFVYFPDLKINPEYLYYIFSTGRPYLGLGKLGTQLNLNTDTVGYISVPIPPQDEIEGVVRFLDDKTARIDTLIEKKRRLIELLKEERQAVINRAVTKGLNPNAGPALGHDRGMKPSGIEWLGDVPEGWKITKLNRVANRIGDGLHGTPEYVEDSEYTFVNGNNLINGKVTITERTSHVSESEYQKYRIGFGADTIFLSINGTIGNVAYYRGEKIVLGKSAAYIDCGEQLDKHFLFYLLQSNSIVSYFTLELTGTTIYNLSLETIRGTPTPLPSRDEQTSIVSYLDTKTNEIATLIEKAERAIELLSEYRTALITEAVTGKIDLSQPNGEENT